jgi:hypothetical protein
MDPRHKLKKHKELTEIELTADSNSHAYEANGSVKDN